VRVPEIWCRALEKVSLEGMNPAPRLQAYERRIAGFSSTASPLADACLQIPLKIYYLSSSPA
jgi:hypothetical protein